MKSIRRVTTGHDGNGKSVFKHDGSPTRGKVFDHTPGFAQFLLWSTEASPCLPTGPDPAPTVQSFHPGPNATRFLLLTLPPDSVMTSIDFDQAAAFWEHKEQTPGIVERFEETGMHTTDTIDYGVVLEGEIWLELDDGEMRHLKQHDFFVQNGTRHGWRNRSNSPATLAIVLVGANRLSRI